MRPAAPPPIIHIRGSFPTINSWLATCTAVGVLTAVLIFGDVTAQEQRPISTPKSDKGMVTSIVNTPGCTVASVAPDRTVTVDWKCADEFAQGDPRNADGALFAIILKAVRDGTAVSK